ncbi:kinase-like protein [Aspergillus steynii IBT 23096]|uniref:Kinase-like protein n=1 Tax=Aspergillus steynii IBT 23096 TaxID=1392250 RepID=A0A2I2G937_9EURO|nr:kinase-like protein [Aspergillus steynii IBT 23096]PLB49389.1 kinase-like protein [Aspergillus steynii IBT 23096]
MEKDKVQGKPGGHADDTPSLLQLSMSILPYVQSLYQTSNQVPLSGMPGMTGMAAATQYCNQDGKEDFGDFVRNDDEEDDLTEVAEPWHKYDKTITPDVFYPIRLGDLINERYLVEHKLGCGGFSTVWMANDLQNNRDVALKIMFAGESGEKEICLQDEIVRNGSSISLEGPCLDCPDVREMSITIRMSAARQLLEALEILHEAGIVHRDLNERNCMWGMEPLHHLPRGAKYEALGRPLKQMIPVDGLWKQGELVGPVKIPPSSRTKKFYLSDFGLAKKVNDSVTPRGYPPSQYCSPDRLHGKDPSPACDMWSYMVIFSELYLGFQPFSTYFNGGIIGGFVRSLGPLPEEWKGLYTHPKGRDSWYDQNQTTNPESTLESKIAHLHPEADPTERSHVLSVMPRVFTYDPTKRLTAAQLLRDPSFRAIMETYGC